MLNDFTVMVNYYNKETGASAKQVYDFNEFAVHHSYQLKRLIDEIELVFSKTEGTTNKDLWKESTRSAFNRLRQKLLNSANAIERLPKTLCYQGVPCNNVKVSELLANMIDQQ